MKSIQGVRLSAGRLFVLALAVASCAAGNVAAAADSNRALAFPGAQGWAAHATGGRGGKVLRVTTLAAEGPGSFSEAVNAKGPRIVVFEVGGVIDLGVKTLRITEPDLTIAGQTAPAPGITLIRGGLDIATNNVIVRHLRVRPGDADKPKRSGFAIATPGTLAMRSAIAGLKLEPGPASPSTTRSPVNALSI